MGEGIHRASTSALPVLLLYLKGAIVDQQLPNLAYYARIERCDVSAEAVPTCVLPQADPCIQLGMENTLVCLCLFVFLVCSWTVPQAN